MYDQAEISTFKAEASGVQRLIDDALKKIAKRALKPVQRKAAASGNSTKIPTSLHVSSSTDPAEKEAETTARDIMRMKDHSHSPLIGNKGTNGFESPYIRRFAGSGIVNQSKGASNSSAGCSS